MVLVLVIGDLHVPMRAVDLPPKFKHLLVPGKIQHVLATGNLCCRETLEYLKGICPDLHVVKGDFDQEDFPDSKIVKIGGFRIGLCHGHQVVPWGDMEALAMQQRQMDVDILVTGHTHKFQAYKYEERCLIINPGSATGAYSNITTEVRPSFVLMDVDEERVVVYVYELVDGEVKVDKIDYQKSKRP
mmetsp:Transcript_664/g.2421  ORF Transcript_664/g.2421 Transcript_664/m.2421 type:complete len:187 (+) Transcript_664:448-1008(+)